MVANVERDAFFRKPYRWSFFGGMVLVGFLYSVKVFRELGSTFKKYAKWLH
jgi:hypothetical protein